MVLPINMDTRLNAGSDSFTSRRIVSLDVLRGIAVLGIFWMNIQSFSAPFSAYANPTVFGDFSGLNYWLWVFGHVFAEFKFMTIFTILFGAGMAIFYQRAEAKGLNAFDVNMQRMLWLMAFGLVHAYLIWYGDILFTYAICGLVVVNLLKLSNKRLSIIAGVLLLVPIGIVLLIHWGAASLGEEFAAEQMAYWAPSEAELAKEINGFKGSWLEARVTGAEHAIVLQFSGMIFVGWRAVACMLLGVIMLRSGFISAQLRSSNYLTIALAFLTLGAGISALGVFQNQAHGFSAQYSSDIGSLYNYVGSLFSAIAYIALTMLLVKSKIVLGFQTALANVGKMAFTNYIMQSLIATFVFYGYGLNYFAEVSRSEALVLVVIVWALQLVLSSVYLSRYKQGPLEQLWRYLSYR